MLSPRLSKRLTGPLARRPYRLVGAAMAVTVATTGLAVGSNVTSAVGSVGMAAPSSPAATPATKVATVHAATVKGVGTVLVTSAGRTLYLFAPDKQKKVTCVGKCQKAWPPLDVKAKPIAGHGVKASLLGTIKAPNGKIQVTYNHWPLYTFVGDAKAGQANGQGIFAFGGSWSTMRATGRAAPTALPPTTSTTTPY